MKYILSVFFILSMSASLWFCNPPEPVISPEEELVRDLKRIVTETPEKNRGKIKTTETKRK